MQIRFREFNESLNNYKLITYFNCEGCGDQIKMLNAMMTDGNPIEISHNDMVEDLDSSYYTIKSIQFVLPEITGNLLPHIAVDVEAYD